MSETKIWLVNRLDSFVIIVWSRLFAIPSSLIFPRGVASTLSHRRHRSRRLRHQGRNKSKSIQLTFGPASIEVAKISKHYWKEGFIKGTIPQEPLSVLNSVIAVCKLSTDLFPYNDVFAASVSMTVGLINLVGCWFGSLSCCHWVGLLAGQYKFGGRNGEYVAKLDLGLVLGSYLVKILDQLSVGVLGVLLLFAGIELAICSRDMKR